MVWLLITSYDRFTAKSVSEKTIQKIKSMSICQSYEQERGSLNSVVARRTKFTRQPRSCS